VDPAGGRPSRLGPAADAQVLTLQRQAG
jgi:hypothetical protein